MANYKKFITLLLIFSIHMIPFNSAWALTTVRDWSITNVTRQGSTTNLQATKSVIINGQVINKTSNASIKPSAAIVAKQIVKTGAAVAVVSAITAILGQAVDWVLDPANNLVKYKPKVSPTDPTQQYYWESQGQIATTPQKASELGAKYWSICGSTAQCEVTKDTSRPSTETQYFYCAKKDGVLVGCGYTANRVTNPNYNPNAVQPTEKTITYDQVAQKIINQADSNDPNAQTYVGSAVDDALANDPATQADASNQLDTNAKTSTNEQATGDTTPKDPADPNAGDTIKLNFPVFCTWAPLVCEAAQTTINFPKTITEWYTSTKTAFTEAYDFAKTKVQEFSDIFKDESQTDTELEFNDPTDDITDTSVSFSSSCLPPIVLADFNFHGIPIHWELDFSAWCDSLSTYLKPIVISMASFSAVLILAGVRENG